MYSKAEASQIKHSFWTAFGKYIAPQLSSEGYKVNWVNYNTGFKHFYFRMDADNKKVSIAIEITHPDLIMRELFFEKLQELKHLLRAAVGEEWVWALHVSDESGKIISKIHKELYNVNVLKQEDWPQIISFFKPRIIALDEFWNNVKESFEELR